MLWWKCWYWNSQYLSSVISVQTLLQVLTILFGINSSVGRYNIVGIMTHYGVDSLGIDIFCTCPDWSWGSPSLLYSGCQLCFPGVQWLGRGIDHLPPSSTEVKEGVELYFYLPSGPSWPLIQWTLRYQLKYMFDSILWIIFTVLVDLFFWQDRCLCVLILELLKIQILYM
jgi:hypothetical protein